MGKCASKDRLGQSRVRKITAAGRSSATIDEEPEKQPFFEKDKDTPEVLSARCSTGDREDGNETCETSVQGIVAKDEIPRSIVSSISYSKIPPNAEDDQLPDFPLLDSQGNPPDEKTGQRETRPFASNEIMHDVKYLEVASSTKRDPIFSSEIINEYNKESLQPLEASSRDDNGSIQAEGAAEVHKSVVHQTIPITTETSFEQDFEVQTDQETSAELETSIADTDIKKALKSVDSNQSGKEKIEFSPQVQDAQTEKQQRKHKEPEAAFEIHMEDEKELSITAPQPLSMQEPLINEHAVLTMKVTGHCEEPSTTEPHSISTEIEVEKIPVNKHATKTEDLQEDFPTFPQISPNENVEVRVHDTDVSTALADDVKQEKLEIGIKDEKISIPAAFEETEKAFVGKTVPPDMQTQLECETISAYLGKHENQSSKQDKEIELGDQISLGHQETSTEPPQAAELVDIVDAIQSEETSVAKVAEDVAGFEDKEVEERDQNSLKLQETLKEPIHAAEVVKIEATKQQEETSAAQIVEGIAGIEEKFPTCAAIHLKMDESSDQTTYIQKGEEANIHVESQLTHDPESKSERNVIEIESTAPVSNSTLETHTGELERSLDVLEPSFSNFDENAHKELIKDAEEPSQLTTVINSEDKEATFQIETKKNNDVTEVSGKNTEESDQSTWEKEPMDSGLRDIAKADMSREQEELEDLESNLSTIVEPDLDRDTETALEEVGGFSSEEPMASTTISESGEAEIHSKIEIESETLKKCKDPYTEAEHPKHEWKAESSGHITMDDSSEFSTEIAKSGDGSEIADHEDIPSDVMERAEHQHGTEYSLPKTASVEEESTTEPGQSTEEEKGDEMNECHGTIVERPTSIEQEPEATIKDTADDNINELTKKNEMDVIKEREAPEFSAQSDMVEETEAMGFIEKVAGKAGPEIQNITTPEMQGVREEVEDLKNDAAIEEKPKLASQREANVASETALLQIEERNSELVQADKETMELKIEQESTDEFIGIEEKTTLELDSVQNSIPVEAEYCKFSDDAELHVKLRDESQPSSLNDTTEEIFTVQQPPAESQEHAGMDINAPSEPPAQQLEECDLKTNADESPSLIDVPGERVDQDPISDDTGNDLSLQQKSESLTSAEEVKDAPKDVQHNISEETLEEKQEAFERLTEAQVVHCADDLKEDVSVQNAPDLLEQKLDRLNDAEWGVDTLENLKDGNSEEAADKKKEKLEQLQLRDIQDIISSKSQTEDHSEAPDGQQASSLEKVYEIQDIEEQERDGPGLQLLEETLQSIGHSEHEITLPQAPQHGKYFNLQQASESQDFAKLQTDESPLIQVGTTEEFAAEDVCSKYSSEEGIKGEECHKDCELALKNQERPKQETQTLPEAQIPNSEENDPELELQEDTKMQDVSSQETIQESFKAWQVPESTESLPLQQSSETQETVAQQISIPAEVQEGNLETFLTEKQLESDLLGQPQTEDESYKSNLEEGFNMAPNNQDDGTERDEKPPSAELQNEFSQGYADEKHPALDLQEPTDIENETSNDNLKESITSECVRESQEDQQNGLNIKGITEEMTEVPSTENQEVTLEGAGSEELISEPENLVEAPSLRSKGNLENQFDIQQVTETLQGVTEDSTSMLVVGESENLMDEIQQTQDGYGQQSSENLIFKEILEKELDIEQASERQEGVEQDAETLQELQASAKETKQGEAQDEDKNLPSEEILETLETLDTQKGDEQETDVSKGSADVTESNLEVPDQVQQDEVVAAKEACEPPKFQDGDGQDVDRVQPELAPQVPLIPQDANPNKIFEEISKIKQASLNCEGVEKDMEGLQESFEESMIQSKVEENAEKEQSSLQVQSGEEKSNLSTSESHTGTADAEQALIVVPSLDTINDCFVETGMESPQKEQEFTKGDDLFRAEPQEIPLEEAETNQEDQQN